MTFADEEELCAFIGRDNWLPQVSAEAVSDALMGFPIELSGGHDVEWLAIAVRRALAISMRHVEDGPKRTSNADIRAELDRLASLAEATWLELFQCDHAADSRLWYYALAHWDGEGGKDIGNGLKMGEPADYRRFKAVVADLDWLARFMRGALKETPSQRGPWRQSEEKRLRIERAQWLAPIYEAAFGQPVSANNYPNDARHKASTPFMEFYLRMVTLAFGARETTNLAEVVKMACKLHRSHPAQFAEGIIPGM